MRLGRRILRAGRDGARGRHVGKLDGLVLAVVDGTGAEAVFLAAAAILGVLWLGDRAGILGVGVGHGLVGAGGHSGGTTIGDQGAVLVGGLAAKRLTGAGIGPGEYILRTEVIRKAAALRLRGGVQQPHQQEEGHHRCNEIGVCHLPGPAVMAAFHHLLTAYDNGAAFAVLAWPVAFGSHGWVKSSERGPSMAGGA